MGIDELMESTGKFFGDYVAFELEEQIDTLLTCAYSDDTKQVEVVRDKISQQIADLLALIGYEVTSRDPAQVDLFNS